MAADPVRVSGVGLLRRDARNNVINTAFAHLTRSCALSRKLGSLKRRAISTMKRACVHRCVTWSGVLDQPSHGLAKSKWPVVGLPSAMLGSKQAPPAH